MCWQGAELSKKLYSCPQNTEKTVDLVWVNGFHMQHDQTCLNAEEAQAVIQISANAGASGKCSPLRLLSARD